MPSKGNPVRKFASQVRNQISYRLNRIRGIRIDSPPIFVVGCGHSGTWLMLSVLGAHSRIYAIPYESGIALKKNHARFRNALARFDKQAVIHGKRRWAEKTPKHILRIGKLLEWCPDAKILILIRDGRDVAYSIRERTGCLEKGIDRWIEANTTAMEFFHLPNVYRVRYEEIVRNFDQTISGVMEFLGETFEPAQRAFYVNNASWTADHQRKSKIWKHRMAQIAKPLYDGRGQWKALSEHEQQLILDKAGALLITLGYDTGKSA